MKPVIRNIAVALAAALGPASTALGAGGREDSSGIFVWIFLAFCALIIVAQLIPSILMLFGMAKGLGKKQEPAEESVKE